MTLSESDLAVGLSHFLSESWGDVHISNLRQSSAGARRLNVMFDATVGKEVTELCATIVTDPSLLEVASSSQLRNSVDAESAVRVLAASVGMPVPQTYGICLDRRVLGGPFFITEFIAGESIPRRIARLVESYDLGATISAQLGTALGQLHSIEAELAPPALVSFANQNPAEAAFELAERQFADLLEPRPAIALGLRWLAAHMVDAPVRRCVVHADVRNGNIIVGEDGLRAVLDWENAVRDDDPMKDLVWPTIRMWRFGRDDLEVGGFSDRDPYIRAYVESGGSYDEDRFHWWKVMRTVSWSLNLAAQAHKYLEGKSTSLVMAASGRRIAELEWDTLMLIRPRAALLFQGAHQ